MVFHIPYLVWTAAGLPILVHATNYRLLKIIIKPLLSFFFLFAALQAIAIQQISYSNSPQLPDFYAVSNTLGVTYINPNEAESSELLAILRDSSAVVFMPSAAIVEMLSRTSFFGKAIFGGLCFAWVGDVCLLGLGSSLWFLAGLVSFLIGHIFYATGFIQSFVGVGGFTALEPASAAVSVLILITVALTVHYWLRKNSGTKLQNDVVMRYAVMAYLGVISFMMLSATYVALTRQPISDTETATNADLKGTNLDVNRMPLALTSIRYLLKSLENYVVQHPIYDIMFAGTSNLVHRMDTIANEFLPSALSKQAFTSGVGALLFYLSDLFVARETFVKHDKWNQAIGLPLYYFGQIFLASSLQYAS